jgi:hypothetical protein
MKTIAETEKTTVRIKGRERSFHAPRVAGLELVVTGRIVRTAQVRDEWYTDFPDPEGFLESLMGQRPPADVFTFVQRPPNFAPMHDYHMELDNIAAIGLEEGYEHWWSKQINSKTRALVRKAEKSGVTVRVVDFNDELVRGIEGIYDETPVRQGKLFWHYKKGFDYQKQIHATYLDRSEFVGAYYQDELVGFIKLVYSGVTANTMHIISKIAYRDKAVNNALVAKAVEVCCAREGCQYLVYDKLDYGSGAASLQLFKRNNGFRKMDLPRYYVPLTTRGRWGLQLGLHRGLAHFLPRRVIDVALDVRSKWYSYRYRGS